MSIWPIGRCSRVVVISSPISTTSHVSLLTTARLRPFLYIKTTSQVPSKNTPGFMHFSMITTRSVDFSQKRAFPRTNRNIASISNAGAQPSLSFRSLISSVAGPVAQWRGMRISMPARASCRFRLCRCRRIFAGCRLPSNQPMNKRRSLGVWPSRAASGLSESCSCFLLLIFGKCCSCGLLGWVEYHGGSRRSIERRSCRRPMTRIIAFASLGADPHFALWIKQVNRAHGLGNRVMTWLMQPQPIVSQL